MAGYIFAISKDGWRAFCEENLKHGHFSPFTPSVDEELMAPAKARSRKATNKVLAAVFGDMVTMKAGDNVYGSTAQLLRQALSNHPSGRKP